MRDFHGAIGFAEVDRNDLACGLAEVPALGGELFANRGGAIEQFVPALRFVANNLKCRNGGGGDGRWKCGGEDVGAGAIR